MLAGLEVPPAVDAERVITAVLADLHSADHRGVVVDSPPGAGKSTLVVRAAVELAAGEPLIIIAREYEVTIVLHPLSGRRDATVFHVESGRLCVLTSRHRHACIVVARAGIGELLDAHPSSEPVQLSVPARFPDGWEANQSMAAYLETQK